MRVAAALKSLIAFNSHVKWPRAHAPPLYIMKAASSVMPYRESGMKVTLRGDRPEPMGIALSGVCGELGARIYPREAPSAKLLF